jgi:hypothetical protein
MNLACKNKRSKILVRRSKKTGMQADDWDAMKLAATPSLVIGLLVVNLVL